MPRMFQNKLETISREWEKAKADTAEYELVDALYPKPKFNKYLADPVLFAREEWNWIASPDEALYLAWWADLENLDSQVMAARGTGKSETLGVATVWSMVFLPEIFGGYMVRILAGSGDQAKRTYNYVKTFLEAGPRVSKLLRFQPKSIYAELKNGASCQVYRLSRQQIHGEHPDLLAIDEACDAEREQGGEILSSAMQSVSSARHGRRTLSSSPYYAFGLFAERWNNAKELGIATYHWTAEPGKRTWIPLRKQTSEWERAINDPTVNVQVEWYGTFGELVGQIHNPKLIDEATQEYELNIMPGAPRWISVDWGFVHPTVIGVWELRNSQVLPLKFESYNNASLEDLCIRIQTLQREYQTGQVYPDSSGVFQNSRLLELGITIVPVTFSTEKEILIGVVNRLLETRKILIHPDLRTLIHQMKAYTRDKSGKPIKVNDDWEDCLLCAAKAVITGIEGGLQIAYGPH